MTDLPSSFSSLPDQDPHKYFRNILIAFKKEIEGACDIDSLQEKMQDILNAAKEMKYKTNNHSAKYKKDESEKALEKIWTEFNRYIKTLQNHPDKANNQDLLESVQEVERLINNNKIL